MSTSLSSENGILIRQMTMEDYAQIKGILYEDVPLLTCFGENTMDMIQQLGEQNYNDTHIAMIEQGSCFVAVDEKNGGRIVGHVLGGCKVASDLEKIQTMAAEMHECNLKRIFVMATEAEIKSNVFEFYGVSQMLYSQITNVVVSMRGKNIGARLAATLMEFGRSKGIPIMVATCISFYSARQKETLGMKCIYSQAYADYKNANGEVVFKPEAPHTHINIMAIKL